MPLTAEQLERLRQTPVGATGNHVQAAIDLMAITQVAVAKGAALPYTYVSDVARGRYQDITLSNARKFAAFFGCLIDDIFPGRDAAAAARSSVLHASSVCEGGGRG